jgi:ribosome-binding ATPase YchF (GTP1/OBG family)
MKIAYTGLNLPEGKTKINDPVFAAMVEKFKPLKVSPYFFEFLPDGYEQADAIVIAADRMLDLLIHDMEKLETRLERSGGDDGVEETELLRKCLSHLEEEKPICDLALEDEEKPIVHGLGFLSNTPTLTHEGGTVDIDTLCPAVMAKAGVMFFYTAGKEEVHAWFVKAGASAVDCAERIHTDLAKGFVKAEIVSFEDLMTAHSIADARSKGLTQLVDRGYVIEENTILEIRFTG